MLEIIHIGDFKLVDDPVKTEETIYNQLLKNKTTINSSYAYVAFPLAYSINTQGVQQTQLVIDNICKQHQDKKLFFVCLHILVNKLNFYGNLVFTPHATILDSYIPIPHYSCNYDTNYSKPWGERKYTYSFMGSFITHPVRQCLHTTLKDRDDCFIVDTGNWHFEGSQQKQQENKKKYIEKLGDTKYSLCPRGTGPSTIRIWESLAMGACPIIFSDFLKMPLKNETKSNLWLRTPERCVTLLGGIDVWDNKEYFELFSNENLYKSIMKQII